MTEGYEIVESYRSTINAVNEGPKSVDALERVAVDLGYTDLSEFLGDNSDAVDAIWAYIVKTTDTDSEWEDSLTTVIDDCGEDFESEECDDDDEDWDEDDEDEDWD